MDSAADSQPTETRRDKLMEAAESGDGFERLRDLTQGYLDSGISKDTLLEDLGQIRGLVDDEVEDHVLDVMDLLVGWCAPDFKLG